MANNLNGGLVLSYTLVCECTFKERIDQSCAAAVAAFLVDAVEDFECVCEIHVCYEMWAFFAWLPLALFV